MSDGDPYLLMPYRLEWRAFLTTRWSLVCELETNPGSLSDYAERQGWQHWGGQFRLVAQHVLSADGLGATDRIRPRSKSEREALLVGYGMALEALDTNGLNYAREWLKDSCASEGRMRS